MKKYLILIILLISIIAHSQTPEKLVPANADFVISINLASLSQKINFNDLGNYSFLQNKNKDNTVITQAFIKELFRMPEKAGVNVKGKILLFSENHDSISNFTYVVSITNNKLFKKRVTEILGTIKNESKFSKYGKFEILNYNNCLSISCSKNVALISIWRRPYYYSYNDEELYNIERNKVINIIDSIRYSKNQIPPDLNEVIKSDTISDKKNEENFDSNEIIDSTVTEEVLPDVPYYDYDYSNDSLIKQFERNWTAKLREKEAKFWHLHDEKMSQNHLKLFTQKNNTQMIADKGFADVYNTGNDFTLWIPLSVYSKKLISMFDKRKSYYQYNDTAKNKKEIVVEKQNTLSELFDNNKFFGTGNFEKGKIEMNFNFEFNNKLKAHIEKINNGNINPEFFKYIKSDNLMGLTCMSINVEAWSDFYIDIFRRAIESNNKPDKKFTIGLELLDLFINKDVIFHTFKGDAALAFTGMKSYLKTFNTWEYDSLTFESRIVQQTKTKYIPEFVYILTIENKSNLDKIISLLNRLEAIKENGKNIWTINSGKNEIDSSFFIVTKDNLFFITNDKKLAKEQIYGNLSSTRVVANTYNSYLSSSSFGFWDASVMFKLMAENNETKEFGNSAFLNKLGEKINNGFYYAKPIKSNQSETSVSIELKNRENSSLLEILNLFDDLNKIK